ncbi:hypothetical protein L486_04589 [Kwoniella mangroviensis CBS 10435]|uniref:Uncharacterized protein n=1 Tax=Kwoniella mangroviensis CBS 10435 TaxID=1331196 RepID=A0A1B9ISQ2_9TREE|nr:hypothetical protein L486_04589 [Kwoniella mangroviensis CBS 10435]OCF78563.1 hypothetical protein I204_00503 [Kwoniella mangroviensis CBS 8886]
MAGPNLEIFKFGFYMFFPIYVMFKFGDPEWYESYVQPYKEILWPPYESTYQPPRTHTGIKEELARMKAERIAKKTGHPVESITASEIEAEGGINVASNGSTSTTTPSIVSQTQSIPTQTNASGWSWPKASGNDNERLV